jgi:hypothetical protein
MISHMIEAWLWSKAVAKAKTTAGKELLNKFVNWCTIVIGKINWKSKRVMTDADRDVLRQKLAKDYYIIVTMHRGFLSSWAIATAHFFMTGKFGYYAHVLMNLEDKVVTDADYRFIEATRDGTQYSLFERVFGQQTSSVALLRPKYMSLDHWTEVMDRAKTYLGRPYDTLFDLSSDQKLSCVELVRDALRGEPHYDRDFANFEAMITKSKNLDPQMFYECPDFVVEWEVRH